MYVATIWEPWAMEFTGPPADGLTPTGQCRRFIADNLVAQDEANEFDDNLLARRCARFKTSFRRERLANEGRNGEFDGKVRKVRERKVCKVQDAISA